MKKIISRISTILIAVVTVWFVWSFIDINSHNNPVDSNYEDYSNGNVIIMIGELFK